jgi:hypothetical protein
MIIARRNDDKEEFMRALDAWLLGRSKSPGNWDDIVLQEPSFQTWLAEVDTVKFIKVTAEEPKLSEEDLLFVQDVEAIPLKAVLENLEWLRQMQIKDAPEDMAKTYRLVRLNLHLREAGFTSDKNFPDFTAALDEDGNFVGSFLDH